MPQTKVDLRQRSHICDSATYLTCMHLDNVDFVAQMYSVSICRDPLPSMISCDNYSDRSNLTDAINVTLDQRHSLQLRSTISSQPHGVTTSSTAMGSIACCSGPPLSAAPEAVFPPMRRHAGSAWSHAQPAVVVLPKSLDARLGAEHGVCLGPWKHAFL